MNYKNKKRKGFIYEATDGKSILGKTVDRTHKQTEKELKRFKKGVWGK